MREIAILVAVGFCACGKEADPVAQPAQAPAATSAAAPQSPVAGKMAPTKAAMLAVPEDKQQLERLLALGYTVHEDHLHPPGVKECPFNMGGGVVQ
ncbi:MAG TPA: hypothetical protein VFY95_04385 [Sphingomicrobium sp.]